MVFFNPSGKILFPTGEVLSGGEWDVKPQESGTCPLKDQKD
jgi:hypothetical protein